MIKVFFKFFKGRDRQLKRPLSCKRPQFQLSEYISPAYLLRKETQIKMLKGILCLCLFFILILLSLRPDYEYRNLEGDPSMLDFFMMSIMFSFAGSFRAFVIRDINKPAVLHRCYFVASPVSMFSASSIRAYALFLESFRFVALVIKLWQSEVAITSLSSAI